jgi:opacity protein-like surface antigen
MKLKFSICRGASLFCAALFMVNSAMADVYPYISAKTSCGFLGQDISFGINADTNKIAKFSSHGTKYRTPIGKFAIGLVTNLENLHGYLRAELEFGISGKKPIAMDDITNFIFGERADGSRKNMGSISPRDKSFLLNFYCDIGTESAFTPYIGCGIGTTTRKFTIAIGTTDESTSSSVRANFGAQNTLTWQIGCGLCYAIDENTALDIGYRYTNMSKMDILTASMGSNSGGNIATSGYIKVKPKCHELLVGMRYTF